MDEPLDITSISYEDLQDEYMKLKERYAQLVVVNEQDTQRIHELRRNLDTALAAELYLSQELEQLSSADSSQDDALLQKKQIEIDELKKRQSALLAENEDLHQDIADLRAENKRLNEKVKELSQASQATEISYHIPKEHIELKERLEEENLVLLAKLDETHENVVKFTMSLAEKEKHIEILKDQVVCLEENLQSKRDEVEEKSQLLESAQEQVVEMNAKIAMLTSCPDDAERKGNSLFAEVDDQRQAMKQLLSDQKKSYIQMKKVYKDSQQEIRRLKSENIAMHTELQACSTIFCSADKAYKDKLNERILNLLKQNEDLEKKLTMTQQELIALANDKGVVWLDSMLLFCKQETEDLKKQLHSIRIQKGILEERLRNSQQDLAKWRFEALKSRCVLIDRESLLAENNIQFRKFTNRDMSFTESELENAKPLIGAPRQALPQVTRDQFHGAVEQGVRTKEINSGSCTYKPPIAVIKIEDDDEVHEVKTQPRKETPDNSPTDTSDSPLPKQECSELPITEEISPENNSRSVVVKVEITDNSPTDTSIFPLPRQKCPELQIKKEISSENKSDSVVVKVETPTETVERMQTLRDVNKNNSNTATASCNLPLTELTNIQIKTEPTEESNKENSSTTPPKSEILTKCNALKELNPPINELKPRPSILIKKKNIFDDTAKSVRFAHVDQTSDCDVSSKPKFACKSTRTKSSVIVRRIIVSSKTKREIATPPAPQ